MPHRTSKISPHQSKFSRVILTPHDEQPLKEVGYFFNPVAKQGTDYRTWPAVNPAIDIDHIFTFKGQKWNVKNIEVPHNSPAFNWSSASDHLPLIAELELTEQ